MEFGSRAGLDRINKMEQDLHVHPGPSSKSCPKLTYEEAGGGI
jgi:hypothetical protein